MLSVALTPRSDDEDHLHESLKPRLTSSPTDSGWDVCTADHLVDSLRILVAKRAVLFGGKNVVKRASTLQVTSQLLAKVFEQTCHILIFLFLCCRFLQSTSAWGAGAPYRMPPMRLLRFSERLSERPGLQLLSS